MSLDGSSHDEDQLELPDLHAIIAAGLDDVFILDDRFEFDAPQFLDLVAESRRMFGPLIDDDRAWFQEHHTSHESSGVAVEVSIVKTGDDVELEMDPEIAALVRQHNRTLVLPSGISTPNPSALSSLRGKPIPEPFARPLKRVRVQKTLTIAGPTPAPTLHKINDRRRKVDPSESADGFATKKPRAVGKENQDQGLKDIEQMLAEHNRQFKPKPTYVPRQHSTRDIRLWEKSAGRLWYSLSPSEREIVNGEITRSKKSQSTAPNVAATISTSANRVTSTLRFSR